MTAEEAHDVTGIDGARLGDELSRIGYLGGSPCPGVTPFAFVELHIEQGPVLEAEDTTIGIVTGVQGISWQELTIIGRSSHAGTTPIALRHDPGYVAMELGSFCRRLANELGPPQVATVGKLDLDPGLVNVVPASATMTVDLRNSDDGVLQEAERRFSAHCEEVGSAEGVSIHHKVLARFEPVCFDEGVLDLVERAASARGYSTRRIPSGAGHDAQMMARICPAGMIFVKSVGGVSHNVTEYTEPHDLAAGANVLLDVLVHLAEQEDPWPAR
jgi:N-carbamoyl-L-amino-acid hydrolase